MLHVQSSCLSVYGLQQSSTNLPAATRRGAVPLVTGGGNDPPSLADDVERRGISGTGAPTTETNSQLSNTELVHIASYQLCRHHTFQLRATRIHNLTS
jgi:hypothetical protein